MGGSIGATEVQSFSEQSCSTEMYTDDDDDDDGDSYFWAARKPETNLRARMIKSKPQISFFFFLIDTYMQYFLSEILYL